MPRVNILPSPSAEVFLSPYEETAFPKFPELFAAPLSSSPLPHLALNPEEASSAIVLENRSERAVTALRYRWGTTDEFGKHNVRTVSGDGYVVDIYRAVAAPGSRRLITPSGSVDEATIDHVQAGGGLIGSGARTKQSGRAEPKIIDLTFEIDFLLFEDGEIAGPDPDQYAREIQVSKTSRGVHRQADSIGNE